MCELLKMMTKTSCPWDTNLWCESQHADTWHCLSDTNFWIWASHQYCLNYVWVTHTLIAHGTNFLIIVVIAVPNICNMMLIANKNYSWNKTLWVLSYFIIAIPPICELLNRISNTSNLWDTHFCICDFQQYYLKYFCITELDIKHKLPMSVLSMGVYLLSSSLFLS